MKRSMISDRSNQSPTKKITISLIKAISLNQRIQNESFFPQLRPVKSLTTTENIFAVNQQIESIKTFVEEVALDPSLLLRLIDYQELIQSLKEEQLQIKLKIQSRKQQLQKLAQKIQQIRNQSQRSPLTLIRRQQNQINQQNNKYLQLIINQKQQRRRKNQQKLFQNKRISQQISILKQNQRIQSDRIKNRIKKIQSNKIELNNKIQQVSKQTVQLKNKFNFLSTKRNIIKNTQLTIQNKNNQIVNLKKQQKQELLKYKNGVMQKKTTQFQIKKNSQKRLAKFIEQLTKCVEKVDREGVNNLKLNYQNRKPQNRQTSSSSDTKPDENQDSWQEDQQPILLDKMEQANPVLKKYRNLDIKTLSPFQSKSYKNQNQKDQQQKQNNKNVKIIEQKIHKLTQEETDLDGFLLALKDKLAKLSKQITEAKNNISK